MFSNKIALRTACFALAVLPSLLGQQPAAPASKPPAGEEVVAVVEGEKITPARIIQLRRSLPPQFAQAATALDDKAFLKSYAGLLVMSRMAEKEKIADHEPLRDQLAFLRMNFLAQAYLDHLNQTVLPSDDDLHHYYELHKSEYDEAKVRAIYVAFSPNAGNESAEAAAGKKLLTEEQAKAKAEALVARLKKGEDFIKLATDNSDDATTAAKGGDAGPIRRSAKDVPSELLEAVFALKEGDVSDPVRQPAGFYILKAEKFRTLPFDEVVADLMPAVKGMKVKDEVDRIMKSAQITYLNEKFFTPAPAPKPERPGGQ